MNISCPTPRYIRLSRHLPALLLAFLLALCVSCRTYIDIAPGKQGSVERPVRCDMPAGQRAYLKLLRGPDGEEIRYEYMDAVAGPGDRILDRFIIWNPAYKSARRGPFRSLLDLMRPDPEMPRWYRIYMNMYHPGVFDREPIPGYTMLGDEKPPAKKPAAQSSK